MRGSTLLALLMLGALMSGGGSSTTAAAHPYAVPSCHGLAAVPGYEKCRP